jgi:hypothetical protein
MKKELMLALMLAVSTPMIFAQQQQVQTEANGQKPEGRPQERVSTFQQVDKVRKALNLDQKQFEKVYKAYESYNKTIYGDSEQASFGPRGGMGGPGGGMGGPGGGMGGPGGGMGGPGGPGGMGGPGGGMGAPSGERPDMSQGSNNRPTPPKEMSEKDMEKMQKKMQKQEEKLTKSVKKAIKDDAKFAEWQKMRQKELMPPKPDQKPGNESKN